MTELTKKTIADTRPEWYRDFTRDYLVTFGRTTDLGLANSFTHWWPAFERMKVTEDELQESTLAILTGAEPFPQFPDRILERLIQEIRRIRSDANANQQRKTINTVTAFDRKTWDDRYAKFSSRQ